LSTNTFEQQVDEMKKKHSELEKKVENIINDYETVECPNTKEIAELKQILAWQGQFTISYRHKFMRKLREEHKEFRKEISSLKQELYLPEEMKEEEDAETFIALNLNEVAKLKEQIDNYNEKCWIPQGNRQINIEKVVTGIIRDIENRELISHELATKYIKKLEGEKEIHHETLEMKGTRKANLGMKVSDETSKPEEPSDSKNVVFPTKLTYEDEHPEDSEYKTPESVKFIKEFDFKKEEPSDSKDREYQYFACYECRKSLEDAKNVRRAYMHWECSKYNPEYLKDKIVVEKEDLQFTELRDKIETLIEYVDQYTHITPSHRAIQILNEFRKKYLEEQTK